VTSIIVNQYCGAVVGPPVPQFDNSENLLLATSRRTVGVSAVTR
jgi:hypothetical protein